MKPTSLLLAGLLLAVTAAATAGFAVRVPCPQCLGHGLVADPPTEVRKTRWIRERDLASVPCSACDDRLRVGLFRKWLGGAGRQPEPPIYRAKDGEAFTRTRRARIADLRDMAVRFTGQDHPPSGRSSRPDLLPIFAEALEDEDGKVRAHAMLAIAEMNLEDALPILLGALNRDDSAVQIYACMGLGWLGRSAPLRDAAVHALTRVADSGDVSELQVQLAAASALFDLDALRSADLFLEALKQHRTTWNDARKALVSFRRKEVVFMLIKKMATMPPDMTVGYWEDLERLTGEKFGDDTVKWYRWFEKNRTSLPPQIE